MEEEYEELSATETEYATCRDDELGRFVAGAFSFSVEPFCKLISAAHAAQGGKEAG